MRSWTLKYDQVSKPSETCELATVRREAAEALDKTTVFLSD